MYTCVADFPKCVYKKGQDCTRQRSDYAENASLALLCMRAAEGTCMFQHYIRLVLYFPATQSTLFSGFFKFCKHIDLQFPSFSPFSSFYLPESRVHVGPRRRSHSHWLFLWYLAPDKLHTWENLHHTLAQQIAFSKWNYLSRLIRWLLLPNQKYWCQRVYKNILKVVENATRRILVRVNYYFVNLQLRPAFAARSGCEGTLEILYIDPSPQKLFKGEFKRRISKKRLVHIQK